jgi:hypothetical protein
MLEISKKLVLCYDPGQFTFRHFSATATDAQLYNLAVQLNGFQTCALDKVLKTRVYEF